MGWDSIVVQCLFRGLQMGWRFGEGIKEGVRPGDPVQERGIE